MSDQPALAEFLEARLAEDWEAATASITTVGDTWEASGSVVEIEGDTKGRSVFEWTVCFDEGAPSEAQADHIARHDPARVLREVAAKRRIMEFAEKVDALAETVFQEFSNHPEADGVALLKMLALPYADHPDFDPNWSTT